MIYRTRKIAGLVILMVILSLFAGCAANTDSNQAQNETPKEESSPTYYFDEEGYCYDDEGNWIDPSDDMQYWDVDSSAFDRVGYSERTHTLDVQFDNSGWYRYTNISPSLFNEFINSESLGGFYNDYIKGQYPCIELE